MPKNMVKAAEMIMEEELITVTSEDLISRHLHMWLLLDCLQMFPMKQTRI